MQMIVIREPTPSLNVILRKFKHPQARKCEQIRWDWLVRAEWQKVPTVTCCEITVTRHSAQFLDWDNMGASLKFLMDALVHNGVIEDDNPSVVMRLHLEQRKSTRKLARTEIEIVPLARELER